MKKEPPSGAAAPASERHVRPKSNGHPQNSADDRDDRRQSRRNWADRPRNRTPPRLGSPSPRRRRRYPDHHRYPRDSRRSNQSEPGEPPPHTAPKTTATTILHLKTRTRCGIPRPATAGQRTGRPPPASKEDATPMAATMPGAAAPTSSCCGHPHVKTRHCRGQPRRRQARSRTRWTAADPQHHR